MKDRLSIKQSDLMAVYEENFSANAHGANQGCNPGEWRRIALQF